MATPRRARAARSTAAATSGASVVLPSGPRAGIDEAGRGPVLGPLVVAGVLVDDESPLREMGVRDSKKLTPAKREALFDGIHSAAAKVAVRVIDARDLDERMGRMTLNEVEVELFADILRELGAPCAVLDACDVDASRFGTNVRARLEHACEVHAEHKADDRHPCVGAASIVAKVTRDRAIAELAASCGRAIGSGYASDPATRAFLRTWVAEHGDLPPFARRRWQTSARLLEPQNRTLSDFTG